MIGANMDDTAEAAVVFEKLALDVRTPVRSTERSAGYDVRAHLTRGAVRVYRHERGAVTEEPPESAPAGGNGRRGEAEGDGGAGPWITLQPGDRALIPTGFRARLPDGYEAQIRMRSSIAWKRGIIVPNAPGTVDADYPDEWFVLVLNASGAPQRITHGERIAQVVLNRHATLEWREGKVGISTDRVGGLGSTGV